MHIIVAIAAVILFGLLAGSVAQCLVPGRQRMSLRATAATGIAGSFLGAFLIWFVLNQQAYAQVGERLSMVGAVIGSVLVLLLWRRYGHKSVSQY